MGLWRKISAPSDWIWGEGGSTGSPTVWGNCKKCNIDIYWDPKQMSWTGSGGGSLCSYNEEDHEGPSLPQSIWDKMERDHKARNKQQIRIPKDAGFAGDAAGSSFVQAMPPQQMIPDGDPPETPPELSIEPKNPPVVQAMENQAMGVPDPPIGPPMGVPRRPKDLLGLPTSVAAIVEMDHSMDTPTTSSCKNCGHDIIRWKAWDGKYNRPSGRKEWFHSWTDLGGDEHTTKFCVPLISTHKNEGGCTCEDPSAPESLTSQQITIRMPEDLTQCTCPAIPALIGDQRYHRSECPCSTQKSSSYQIVDTEQPHKKKLNTMPKEGDAGICEGCGEEVLYLFPGSDEGKWHCYHDGLWTGEECQGNHDHTVPFIQQIRIRSSIPKKAVEYVFTSCDNCNHPLLKLPTQDPDHSGVYTDQWNHQSANWRWSGDVRGWGCSNLANEGGRCGCTDPKLKGYNQQIKLQKDLPDTEPECECGEKLHAWYGERWDDERKEQIIDMDSVVWYHNPWFKEGEGCNNPQIRGISQQIKLQRSSEEKSRHNKSTPDSRVYSVHTFTDENTWQGPSLMQHELTHKTDEISQCAGCGRKIALIDIGGGQWDPSNRIWHDSLYDDIVCPSQTWRHLPQCCQDEWNTMKSQTIRVTSGSTIKCLDCGYVKNTNGKKLKLTDDRPCKGIMVDCRDCRGLGCNSCDNTGAVERTKHRYYDPQSMKIHNKGDDSIDKTGAGYKVPPLDYYGNPGPLDDWQDPNNYKNFQSCHNCNHPIAQYYPDERIYRKDDPSAMPRWKHVDKGFWGDDMAWIDANDRCSIRDGLSTRCQCIGPKSPAEARQQIRIKGARITNLDKLKTYVSDNHPDVNMKVDPDGSKEWNPDTDTWFPQGYLMSTGKHSGPSEVSVDEDGNDLLPYNIHVKWNPYVHERDHATMTALHEVGHVLQAKDDWSAFWDHGSRRGLHSDPEFERDAFERGMGVAKQIGIRVTPRMKEQWKRSVGGEHLGALQSCPNCHKTKVVTKGSTPMRFCDNCRDSEDMGIVHHKYKTLTQEWTKDGLGGRNEEWGHYGKNAKNASKLPSEQR